MRCRVRKIYRVQESWVNEASNPSDMSPFLDAWDFLKDLPYTGRHTGLLGLFFYI